MSKLGISTIRQMNQGFKELNHDLRAQKEVVEENTQELKKITQEIEYQKELSKGDWKKLDPYNEQSKRPMVNTPLQDDVAKRVLKKLGVL